MVFARAPELGRVKTRLEPVLGKARTLDLYRAFLADTLHAAQATSARVVLVHTATSEPFEERMAADACVLQPEGTFGTRFDHALGAAGTDARSVVLVGADTPHIGSTQLGQALRLLERHTAVLGPGTEGGFYLLGVRAPAPSISHAFDEPNEAAAMCRILRPALLESSFDVDVPRDLTNLILHIETLEAAGLPVPRRTQATIRAMGLRVETAQSGSRERRLIVG